MITNQLSKKNMFLKAVIICLGLFICCSSCKNEELTKHPLDQSEIKTLVLENQLKVVLLSDPTFNKSAASMHVHVGSLDNPDNAQGLLPVH